VVVSNHLSTDLDEDDEIAESTDLRRGSMHRDDSDDYDEEIDHEEEERGDQSTMMEDSLNEVCSCSSPLASIVSRLMKMEAMKILTSMKKTLKLMRQCMRAKRKRKRSSSGNERRSHRGLGTSPHRVKGHRGGQSIEVKLQFPLLKLQSRVPFPPMSTQPRALSRSLIPHLS
jgi:hypothetical protein